MAIRQEKEECGMEYVWVKKREFHSWYKPERRGMTGVTEFRCIKKNFEWKTFECQIDYSFRML